MYILCIEVQVVGWNVTLWDAYLLQDSNSQLIEWVMSREELAMA